MQSRGTIQINRRWVLVAAAGNTAVALAAAVAGPARALAASGAALLIGTSNQGTTATGIKVAADPALKCRSDQHDGLWGQSAGSGSSGVYGIADHAQGFGVAGRSTPTGATGWLGGRSGVRARATGRALALQVDGRASFSRSGGIKVPAGQQTAYLYLGDGAATPNTKVLATLQTPGTPVDNCVACAFVREDGSLVVVMKEKPDRDLWVAWWLLE
jgi:hypothetical protein